MIATRNPLLPRLLCDIHIVPHYYICRGGDVAQLAERRTGRPLTQVRFPAAARDMLFPESTFSVDSLNVPVARLCRSWLFPRKVTPNGIMQYSICTCTSVPFCCPESTLRGRRSDHRKYCCTEFQFQKWCSPGLRHKHV